MSYDYNKLRELCIRNFKNTNLDDSWNYHDGFNCGYFYKENNDFHFEVKLTEPDNPKSFYDCSLWVRCNYDYPNEYSLFSKIESVNPITKPDEQMVTMIKHYKHWKDDLDCNTYFEYMKRLNSR